MLNTVHFFFYFGPVSPFSLVPTSFSNLRCRDRISPLYFFSVGGRPSGGGKYWAIFSEGGGGGPSWTPPKPILYLDRKEDRPPDRPQLFLKKRKGEQTVATLTPKISLAPSTRAASRKGRNRTKSLLGVHKGSSKS